MSGIPKSQRAPERRFWSKVDTSAGPAACWPWTASLSKGYGQFWTGERLQMAHIWAWEHEVGPVPEGHDLDHTCHNADSACADVVQCRHRRCVNPAHLQPVPHRINLLRGQTLTARNAAVTECPYQHPYDEANTYFYRGSRFCRACFTRRNREATARRRNASS